MWPFKWLKLYTLPLLNSGLEKSFLLVLDVRGGRTDHTAFFCTEVTFFFSTILKYSANSGWTASSI